MEFYCNRDTDCDISDYLLVAFDPGFGDFAIMFPPGTVIAARQRLLRRPGYASIFRHARPQRVVRRLGRLLHR